MGVRERDMYIGREKLGLREIWRHVYIGSEMRACDRDFAHVRGEETEDLKRELKKHGREEGESLCVCLRGDGLIFLCGRECVCA